MLTCSPLVQKHTMGNAVNTLIVQVRQSGSRSSPLSHGPVCRTKAPCMPRWMSWWCMKGAWVLYRAIRAFTFFHFSGVFQDKNYPLQKDVHTLKINPGASETL